ncbi:hypothetical protein BC829DRAFT_400054 [Chytridium lagenaria]|nr:hypothetical protein BC829DRAFT_400054 [Chytridium lagenaria]
MGWAVGEGEEVASVRWGGVEWSVGVDGVEGWSVGVDGVEGWSIGVDAVEGWLIVVDGVDGMWTREMTWMGFVAWGDSKGWSHVDGRWKHGVDFWVFRSRGHHNITVFIKGARSS